MTDSTVQSPSEAGGVTLHETAGPNASAGPAAAPGREAQPIRWKDAFVAFVALTRDNDDTTHVFEIIDALSGNFVDKNVERMRAHPTGRQILAQRRSMLELLSDRERLRALPEGSLGRVYLAFMEREGLTADGLADASEVAFEEAGDDLDRRTFGEWARDSHDLWHVLTGYGRDPLGELCLLGVLYSQIRSPGTAFISLLGLTQVRREYPGAPCVRAVLQGFRIGRRAEWMVAQDWAALLERPIDVVRASLRLEPPTFYERSLPLHDASRSGSRAARERAQAADAEAQAA